MADITCFMLAETGRRARFLRRYRAGGVNDCPLAHRYHNAMTRIEDGPESDCEAAPRQDPRWPVACACGYRFADDDHWQLFPLTLWRMQDGRDVVLHDSPPPDVEKAPPGAMWFIDWCPGPKKHGGPYLWMMTPGGPWAIDGPSNNGDGWTRTGTPPVVTANPSIHIPGRYHGWLRDGRLIEC